jgi:serine/threonine-protein kinase
MELKAGDRVDRYTLLAPLGGGGQGTVWRVLDPLDGGVERALKLIATETLPPDAAERARREARTMAAAPHPAVVACYGLFEDVATGLVGLVLELVEGRPLHEAASDPRMTDDHRQALLLQLAEALAHIHAMEIVHRDLKPDNVLVTERFWETPRRPGTIKLVDFGIAVRLGNPRPLTMVGDIVGTAPYLAPEALLPGVKPSVGYARDVFAFGVLAYELFTGEHPTGLPFDAIPPDFVIAYARVASGPDPWPPGGVPAPWREPVARCLALHAAERPASGVDLLDLVLGLTAPAAPSGSQRPTWDSGSSPFLEIEDSEIEEVARSPRGGVPSDLRETNPVPRPRAEAPPAPGAERRRAGPSKIATGLLLLALVALGVASFVSAPREAAVIPVASVSAAPVRSAHAPPTPSACPVTCCGGYACTARPENARGCVGEAGHCRACPSDRACVPGPCEGRIPDAGVWLLRPASVTASGKDVTPRPRVCLRPSGAGEDAWFCHGGQVGGHPQTPGQVPGHPQPPGADRHGPRLRVTTADLTHEGIDLSVTRADGTTAIGTGVHHPAIGVAALCRGLNFRFTSGEGVPYAVTVFLDDPDDGPAP